jgi:hypothetical protein
MNQPNPTDVPKIRVNLAKDSTAILCECGSEFFQEVMRIRRISRLLTGEPEDRIMPVPAVLCVSCGKECDPTAPTKPSIVT